MSENEFEYQSSYDNEKYKEMVIGSVSGIVEVSNLKEGEKHLRNTFVNNRTRNKFARFLCMNTGDGYEVSYARKMIREGDERIEVSCLSSGTSCIEDCIYKIIGKVKFTLDNAKDFDWLDRIYDREEGCIIKPVDFDEEVEKEKYLKGRC